MPAGDCADLFDATRIVRSWLDEGVTQLPDRVLDAVLDEVPATPQRDGAGTCTVTVASGTVVASTTTKISPAVASAASRAP